jgi:cytochrome c biogenesis protein CcmG/thiol:disulfide interchange protein DsbE
MAEVARRPKLAPVVTLAVAAVMAGLLWVLASGGDDSTSASSFLIGRSAPAVVTETIDGEPFDLSRRKGSWVVLNFFQSSCAPCKAEHPELLTFVDQQRSLPGGAEFYTIVFDERSLDDVRRFFAERGGDWPILLDEQGSISVSFGVPKVPETWIIDPNGVVMRRYAGMVAADQLAGDLQQLRDLSGL